MPLAHAARTFTQCSTHGRGPFTHAPHSQIINSYGLAFLNAHLRPDSDSPGLAASAGEFNAGYLTTNHFGDEVLLNAKP